MTVYTAQVAAGADDARDAVDGSAFAVDAAQLGRDALTDILRRMFGIRFPSTGIASGSTVSACAYTWQRTAAAADSPQVDIYCENVDSAADFTASAVLASRAKTSASTSYTVTGAGAGTKTSADFAGAAQEVVNRAGFSGVLMVLVVGKNQITVEDYEVVRYETNPATCCGISITYTAPAGHPTMRRWGGSIWPGPGARRIGRGW